ncbi:MAG: thiamine pyrophosphate-dependent enzyme [Chloroflexi bacterium]|nr:thiamine pyrophosphate-dependent enzyme [Chloroflexota bacterium]
MTMKRDQMLHALARHRTDEVVVAVYRAANELIHIDPSELNYTFNAAMGQGSSAALGIALARPDRRVVVLDGDGSLLMNLGTLVTIADAAPANLLHCVCSNGTYETNGAVPVPGVGRASFAALALAAGYRDARRIEGLEEWDAALPELLAAEGPVLVDLAVEPGEETWPDDFRTLHSTEARDRFIAALASVPLDR